MNLNRICLLSLIALSAPAFGAEPYPCLPANIHSSDVVDVKFLADGKHEVTLGQKLHGMGARCRNGKLITKRGKEIKFFRREIFGAPTSYAMETSKRQAEELKELQKKYEVIVLSNRPPGEPAP
jgi:hypothetical protein